MIVFVSNYYNHHQSGLSEALYRLTGGEYCFIATEKMKQYRKELGYREETAAPFLLLAYKNKENRKEAKRKINQADVVICGSAPEKLLRPRLRSGKLTFRYSERIFKNGCKKWQLPLRTVKYFFRHGRYENLYLLCASAYTAADYAKCGVFRGKAYKWGYFPQVKQYENEKDLMAGKSEMPVLLWVGRLIDLKHPEAIIEIAGRLKQAGCEFRLDIIGTGELENDLKKMVCSMQLEAQVRFLGAMKPEEVRTHMERANIYLFTSDFHEGWGAVLNESMNSGCAVVASHAIGSVPYLLKHGENGLIYKNGDLDDFYEKVKLLLEDRQLREKLGSCAYKTMTELWNAHVAAERFLQLSKAVCSRNDGDLYHDGPCSRADVLENDWF